MAFRLEGKRWFIWTITAVVVIGVSLAAYITYVGYIDGTDQSVSVMHREKKAGQPGAKAGANANSNIQQNNQTVPTEVPAFLTTPSKTSTKTPVKK